MEKIINKKILFTRSTAQNLKDQRLLEDTTHQCFQVPLIETIPLGNQKKQLNALNSYDWVFFTSSNTVSYFMKNCPSLDLLKQIKIAAIGKQTNARLVDFGLQADFIPTLPTSSLFIQEWLAQTTQQNQKILLPKSDLAKSTIKLALEAENHFVVEQIIYQNKLPRASEILLKKILCEQLIDIVIFASPSAWFRFYEVFQTLPKNKQILFGAIGPVTHQAILSSKEYAVLPKEQNYSIQGLLTTLNLI